MASSDTDFSMVNLPIDMSSSAIVFSTVTRMLYLEQKIKVFDKVDFQKALSKDRLRRLNYIETRSG